MEKKLRAWGIVLSGTLITGTVYAAVVNCYSIFIIPICETHGFARGWYNLSLTLLYFAYMVGSMLSGSMFRRFNLKKLMEFAGIAIPVLYFSMSYVSSLSLFYLIFILMGLFMPFISFAAYTVLIHDWFEEGEGTAVGIAFMGSGIGGMVLNFLVAGWIQSYGYQFSLRALSLIMLVIAAPVSLFLVKPNHENYGVSRNGTSRLSLFVPGTGRLVLVATLIGFGITILSQTLPPHLEGLGFSPMYAASMNAFFMGGLCVAKLVMGYMYDKLGVRKTSAIAFLLGIAGALSYFFGSIRILHPMIVIGAGMAVAIGSVAYPILTRYMCKPENFASASGTASAFSFLGSAVAPFFMNTLFDRIGSYRPGYLVSVVTFVVCLWIILGSRPYDAKE